MATEKQLANLRPPFSSTNQPANRGRGARRALSEAYDTLLRKQAPMDVVVKLRKFGLKPGATVADIVAVCLFRETLKGNSFAAKEMREGSEGKAAQRIELLAREDQHVELEIVFEQNVFTQKLSAQRNGERIVEVEAEAPAETEHEPSTDVVDAPQDTDS